MLDACGIPPSSPRAYYFIYILSASGVSTGYEFANKEPFHRPYSPRLVAHLAILEHTHVPPYPITGTLHQHIIAIHRFLSDFSDEEVQCLSMRGPLKDCCLGTFKFPKFLR